MKIRYHFLLTCVCTLFSLTSYSQLKIIEGGNVGIDYTDPDYKLKVNGTGYFNGTLTATGAITGASYKIGANDINTAGTLSNVAYENQANTFSSTQNIIVPGTNITSLVLDGSTWFNLGSGTGYGNINWFTKTNGTSFINTHGTVKPSQITADANGIRFNTAPDNGGINAAANLITRLVIGCDGNITTSGALTVGGVVTAPTMKLFDISGNAFSSRYSNSYSPFIISSDLGIGETFIGWNIKDCINYDKSNYATKIAGYNGQFVFSTAPSGTVGNAITFTPRLTIGNNGNVGIGTTAPGTKLEVATSGNTPEILRLYSGQSYPDGSWGLFGGYQSFYGKVDGTYNYSETGRIGYKIMGHTGANFNSDLYLGGENAGSFIEGLRITGTGHVGIGYASGPEITNNKLAVNGNLTATSLIRLNGTSSQYLMADGSVTTGRVTMDYPTAGIALSTGTGWGASITNNSAHWNSAYNAIYSATLSSVYLPKWNGSYLVNSLISDNGSNVTVSGNLTCSDLIVSTVNASTSLKAEGNLESHYGDIVAYGGNVYGVNVIETSDQSLKTNIVSLPSTIDKLLSLRPVTFNFKTQEQTTQDNRLHMGFIAQEVIEVFPDIVYENKDGLLGISYTQLIPALVQALKEQNEEIKSLRTELQNLKTQLNN